MPDIQAQDIDIRTTNFWKTPLAKVLLKRFEDEKIEYIEVNGEKITYERVIQELIFTHQNRFQEYIKRIDNDLDKRMDNGLEFYDKFFGSVDWDTKWLYLALIWSDSLQGERFWRKISVKIDT